MDRPRSLKTQALGQAVRLEGQGHAAERWKAAPDSDDDEARGSTATRLRSPRVLAQDDGSPFTQKIVRVYVMNASRLANLENRGVHILRHTFCSHLAMRGAPARAIQELAGYQDLSTTQRYMHLSPRAAESAIRLLEEAAPTEVRGNILETGNPSDDQSKGFTSRLWRRRESNPLDPLLPTP